MKIAGPAALSAAVVGGLLGRALRRRHRRVAEAIDPALRSPVLYLPLDVRDERTLRVGRALVPLASPRATVPVRDERARGAAGHDVRVQVFEPNGRRAPSGALLWVHGGGLVLGAPEADNRFLSGVASALGIVVVGVDYRLAPEHPFPAALDDCATALAWLHDNAAALGVDPQRIAIGGGSAGGGLAASLAQRTLDEGGPPICFQALLYPMLDDRTAARTDHAARSAMVWTNVSNRFGWKSYLGTEPGAEDVPDVRIGGALRRPRGPAAGMDRRRRRRPLPRREPRLRGSTACGRCRSRTRHRARHVPRGGRHAPGCTVDDRLHRTPARSDRSSGWRESDRRGRRET